MLLRKLLAGWFSVLPRLAIRHPRCVVLLACAVTLAAAPGLMRLTLRTDGHALVSESAPEVRYDRLVREEFGIEDPFVVVVRSPHPDGIFNAGTIQLVRALTADFAKVSLLHPTNLISLATEPNFRHRPGTIQFQTFLEPALKTKPELDQLRDDLQRIQLYTGTLVSYDGRATSILIGAPTGADRTALYRLITGIIAGQGTVPETVSVVGAPVAEALLGTHILEDLGVPKAWLGTTVQASANAGAWRWPGNWYEVRLMIARQIGLLPVALALLAAIFYISFRRMTAVLLPLMEVGACLVFVFGIMGWTGVPIYLTIAVMPVILTAMGICDEVYLFSRYVELLRERPGTAPVPLVAATMDEMCSPVVSMAATTAIGFLSFAFSPLEPVRAFGIFTAVGILFCLLWTLTVIPALLVLIPPAKLVPPLRRRRATESGLVKPWIRWLARGVIRHRYLLLGASLGVALVTPLGLRQIAVQDSWIDGFDPASDFRNTTRFVNEQFRGTHTLLVTFDAGHRLWQGELAAADADDFEFRLPGDLVTEAGTLTDHWLTILGPDRPGNSPARLTWRSYIESASFRQGNLVLTTPRTDASAKILLNPRRSERMHFEILSQPHMRLQTFERLAELSAFIEQRTHYKVGGVLSAPDFVATTRFMLRPQDETRRQVPRSPHEIKLMWDYYRIVRGEGRLRQVVDTNYARSLVTIFLKDANFADTARLMGELRGFERERLAPHGIKLGFAGDVAVSQALIDSIVTTQVQSLAFSLLGILVVTSFLGGSLRWGLYCVLPSGVAVLVNFALMGWWNIPMGVATSMFAGMTLGMGVDFSIHLLERFQRLRAAGLAQDSALTEALVGVGPAVLTNALGVAVGFSVLMLSQVPANARLGLLVVLGIFTCVLVTFLILPALFRLWPPPGVRRP